MDAVECFPPGVPRVYLHPFPMEIVQTPGRVLLIYEFNHFTADFHGWTKAFDRRQLRECATGDYMDPFADWLKSAGFRRRSAQLLLRGAAHLGEWAAIEQVRIEQFDQRVLDTFAGHLATCCCTHPFRGGDRRNLRGAKRCIEHLQIRGITAFAE